MSNFISIHDTHKLPYRNATITAKTVQSGNTTPLKFINAAGDPLGYKIRTNADGYLCDLNGTLFTSGVFVSEDAYVTMELLSGGSTSWIVRADSDDVINDGKLLGKKVPVEQQSPNEEYEKYGGEWRLVLHSANTPRTRELLFDDLAGVPNFNEWNEAEQVEMLAGDKAVSIGVYTKTLLLLWDAEAPVPSGRSPIYVTVSADRVGQRSRFAQHCIVMNNTPYRITLRDEQSGKTIGSVDPYEGTLNIGLFFIADESTGNWVVDEDLLMFNNTDERDGDRVKLSGAPTNGFFEITVNDRTPSTLVIEADDVQLSAVPTPGEIAVKLIAETGKLTKAKRVTLWFINVGGGNADTLPLKVCYSNNVLCLMQSATLCEILVPALGENSGFTDSFGPVLLDTSERALTNMCSKTLTGGTQLTVPLKCQQMGLTITGTGDSNIVFQSTQQVVRFDVVNNTGSPVWFNLQALDMTTQLEAVCPANQACHFIVRNDYGKLTAVSETKSYPTAVVEDHTTEYTYSDRVSYDIRGLATTLVINCDALNKETGVGIGRHSDCRSRVYLDVSKVITDGTQHTLTVEVAGFITKAGLNEDDGVIIHIGSQTSGHDESAEVTHAEKMSAEDEERYYINPVTASFKAYKNGVNYNITDKHFR